jgi:hypothetical protein
MNIPSRKKVLWILRRRDRFRVEFVRLLGCVRPLAKFSDNLGRLRQNKYPALPLV